MINYIYMYIYIFFIYLFIFYFLPFLNIIMLELDHKCLEFQDHKYVSWHYLFEKKLCFNRGTRGTFSVKFRIYMHHTTIFRGVLGNSPTYFYHFIII
jgi:hypothetical protein